MSNPINPAKRPALAMLFPDFGDWLTFAEAVKSDTAIRLGIANVPTATQYDSMNRAYKEFYIPICRQFGKLPVSSFFRCPALNKAVGGSATSSHMDGLAMDIDCDSVKNVSNKELYAWIRKNLKFDQVITEFPDKNGDPGWIHVSFRAKGYQRQMAMRAVKKGNSVVYMYE